MDDVVNDIIDEQHVNEHVGDRTETFEPNRYDNERPVAENHHGRQDRKYEMFQTEFLVGEHRASYDRLTAAVCRWIDWTDNLPVSAYFS